jgi:hypothetical protein
MREVRTTFSGSFFLSSAAGPSYVGSPASLRHFSSVISNGFGGGSSEGTFAVRADVGACLPWPAAPPRACARNTLNVADVLGDLSAVQVCGERLSANELIMVPMRVRHRELSNGSSDMIGTVVSRQERLTLHCPPVPAACLPADRLHLDGKSAGPRTRAVQARRALEDRRDRLVMKHEPPAWESLFAMQASASRSARAPHVVASEVPSTRGCRLASQQPPSVRRKGPRRPRDMVGILPS